MTENPFILSGYVSDKFFCDREEESSRLIREITNGNNLAIIATRRMGKTGLIEHCFRKKEISKNYYTFFIDIYATRSLRDFIFSLSKVILEGLKPFGKKAVEKFINSIFSLRAGITYDVTGTPSFNLHLGEIQNTMVTLDEIFNYLSKADKPCIVAIDEFQQITSYPEKNIEALLRTHIQHSNNARFIFAGSQRHMMGNMFLSASRPFYQSVSMMHLESISLEKYTEFTVSHFRNAKKDISAKIIEEIYNRFNGVTWYLQKIMNALFSHTTKVCNIANIDTVINSIISTYRYTYQETLFRLPQKQKELLIAIAKEGDTQGITSGKFVKKYSLLSPSSVQSALNGLLEKDFLTSEEGIYRVYDKFLEIWLNENY